MFTVQHWKYIRNWKRHGICSWSVVFIVKLGAWLAARIRQAPELLTWMPQAKPNTSGDLALRGLNGKRKLPCVIDCVHHSLANMPLTFRPAALFFCFTKTYKKVVSFVWGSLHMSPLTGLTWLSEISPSHYFLCKNSDVFIWEPGQPDEPRSRSRRPGSRLTGLIWTLQPSWPGWKYFNCACLNGRLVAAVAVFWLICSIFHFKSLPFSCSDKVTRVDQATARGTIEISSRGAIFDLYSMRLAPFSSRSTGMKFLIWTHDRADPVDRATGLWWTQRARATSVKRNSSVRRTVVVQDSDQFQISPAASPEI